MLNLKTKIKMENTEEKNNNPATGAALEEAVLKYLADNHPDDQALDEMMQLLQGESDKLVEAVYKGLRYARDVDAASADGYLRGRNEAVEQKRNALQERPKDDGGAPTDYDLPLLRNIRRSVWD